jgi:uncharacterized phage protein (TIGR02218 family)
LALSQAFAARFLAPLGNQPVTLTIFRGHEQVLGETVAHWKGRVVGAEVEGARLILSAESIFSTLRRAGVRAKYQSLCRHALFGRGCGLDIAQHLAVLTVAAVSGGTVTVPGASVQPDGWYRGGVLRFGVQLGFIIGHVGATITLSRPMPEIASALADPAIDPVTGTPLLVTVDIAPGCDLRAETCAAKFGNLLNFGGFPVIPGRNPFGGGSVV